jgi:hypothetical protein
MLEGENSFFIVLLRVSPFFAHITEHFWLLHSATKKKKLRKKRQQELLKMINLTSDAFILSGTAINNE